MAYTVYCHTNKINGKKYVGVTKQKLRLRWANGLGYRSQPRFFDAIKKHGWEEFTHEVLFTELTKEAGQKKEIELIAKWKLQDINFGYNAAAGGDGPTGYRFKRSESEKQWLSQINKGKKLSEITKKKLSEAHKGKKQSIEIIQNRVQKNKKSVVQMDLNGNEIQIFNSIKEAGEVLGLRDSTGISGCCKGKYKNSGGYKWRYVE